MTSGGRAGNAEATTGPDPVDRLDDDEASRESFPASDPPSSWAGEEFSQPEPEPPEAP
jgi:hypothetical protein